eukprot:COSAG02_NODE_3131_length_7311_cov_11.071131_8_plen_90_part_00
MHSGVYGREMIAGMQTKNAKGYPKMLAHLKHYTAVSRDATLVMLQPTIINQHTCSYVCSTRGRQTVCIAKQTSLYTTCTTPTYRRYATV